MRFRRFVVCRYPCQFRKLPAAQLRLGVGPLASRKAVAGRSRQRDIIGHNRAYPGISEHSPIPGISGHFRTREARRVPYRPLPVTPSRMARRVRYRPSPDTTSGMVVACGTARRRIACRRARRSITSRHIPAHLGDLTSLRWSRSGTPHTRRLPCPGPTAACSRRRYRRFTNMYSFTWPWRSIVARSAARLRRIVGPLSRHGACRTGAPLTSL